MFEITKTELVWPGKYDENGKLREVEIVNLPFQVIETVNETRATREAKKNEHPTLFDMWDPKEGDTFEEGWKNKLIWGDNKYVMSSLLEKFAGKIDLIYIDPPFATGADFSFKTQIGDEEVTKEQSIIEEKAYRDTWGKGIDSYLQMMYERLVLMRDLLSDTGSIYVHLDWHVGHYCKAILDEIFGTDNFVNEIVWHYRTGNIAEKIFARRHDTIFLYQKLDSRYFEPIEIKEYYKDIYGPSFKPGFKGRKAGRDEYGDFRIVYADDVWDISAVFTLSNEHLPYNTQKPEKLLERIITTSSKSGDLVADFFCGSGTTLAKAEKLGRRWIGCDLGRYAIHTTRKRLMGIENCKPFEILNLGKYERQVWQGISFNGKDRETILYEYLAFILKLYGAEPISGFQHLHGKKGKALVHIGAVDAPVTIDEVLLAMEECKAASPLSQRGAGGIDELHVLGWEWEMGMNDLIVDEAKSQGIKLRLLLIPNEAMESEAVRKGDVRFFELAYLQTKIETNGRKVTVELTDFVIPNTELIPQEVREKITKWLDYVDYWAVDFNFQNDTFVNQWTSYRTRKERTLNLKSDPYTYDSPGKYKILVKVIDVFGIDTSQAFEVEVS